MIRRVLLVAIAFGFFTLPVHAEMERQHELTGKPLSSRVQLVLSKHACQLLKGDSTTEEIIESIAYLVKANTPHQYAEVKKKLMESILSDPYGERNVVSAEKMSRAFDGLDDVSNQYTALNIVKASAQSNCMQR